MNKLIDHQLKSIRMTETAPNGTESVTWISANEHFTEYEYKRVIGEMRYDLKETLYGGKYHRVVITDYETGLQTVRTFEFPRTEEESEQRHAAHVLTRKDKKKHRRRELQKRVVKFICKIFPEAVPHRTLIPSANWEAKCYYGGNDERRIIVFNNDVQAATNILSICNGKMLRCDLMQDGSYDIWLKNGKRYKVTKKYF